MADPADTATRAALAAFLAKPFDVPNLLDVTKRFVGAKPALS